MRLRDPYRQSRRLSLLGLAGVVLVFVIGMGWLILSMVGRSFVAEEDLEIDVAGLSSTVTITRDDFGIPYIVGSTDIDVALALGYAHAQDRLWQMEVGRRTAFGRLSEVFGTEYVGYDHWMRTVGIGEVAARIHAAMPEQTKAVLQAYSDGVNRFIETHEGRIPYEFDALGYEPEQWTPEASIAIMRLVAWQQNNALWADLLVERVATEIDSALAADLLPPYPSYAPTMIPGGQRPDPELERLRAGMPPPDTTDRDDSTAADSTGAPSDSTAGAAEGATAGLLRSLEHLRRLDGAMRADAGFGGTPIGSNAWAISSHRTLGGGAILASDPHDRQTIPSKWYQAVLITDGEPLAGVTIPGVPCVMMGRNRHVAWGLTNLMADESDLYLERLHPEKKDRVLHDGRWEALELRHDTIEARDSAGTPITIRSSRHGPILSDLLDVVDNYPIPGIDSVRSHALFGAPADTLALAMRWTGRDVTDEITAFRRLAKAGDLTTFRRALESAGVPGYGVIYADRTGRIAALSTFNAPNRPGTRLERINPGWESRYNWRGRSRTRLPSVVDPDSGYVAAANNRVTNGAGPDIGNLWDDPSRALRIRDYLNEGNQLEVIDCVQMQGDVVSPFMSYAVEFLIRAFPDSTRQGEKVRETLGRLRRWNGEMNAEAPEGLIVAAWLDRVMEMTWRDELGEDLYAHLLSLTPLVHRALRHQLLQDSRWFDDVTTRKREVRDDVLRIALGETLDELHERFDTWELDDWTFGRVHQLTFRPPFNIVGNMAEMVDVGPFEIGGSATTLNSGSWDLRKPYDVILGPSMRQIVDFADTTVFLRTVLSTGQSGQPMNDRYDDQTIIWLFNGYIPIRSSPPAEEDALSVITLNPA